MTRQLNKKGFYCWKMYLVEGWLSKTLAKGIDSTITKGVTVAITDQLHTTCTITVVDIPYLTMTN